MKQVLVGFQGIKTYAIFVINNHYRNKKKTITYLTLFNMPKLGKFLYLKVYFMKLLR